MNEVLQNIMTFINENTFLLIGICVFLIFVLIGYLIDNSVKSKRVRKDIKNKDQVPEEIKNEIIKEAINENKEKMMENSFHNAVREDSEEVNSDEIDLEDKKVNIEETINMELNFDEVPSQQEDLNISSDLDNSSISAPFSLDNEVKLDDSLINNVESQIEDNSSKENIISEPFSFDLDTNEVKSENDESSFMSDINLEGNNNQESENLIIDIPTNIGQSNISDPDVNIMNVDFDNNKYKNDKKLSEILFNVDKERVNDNKNLDISLFKDKPSNLEVNNDVEKSKVEIEIEENSSDELDKIMKKLSSINNDEEDNYTNIF